MEFTAYGHQFEVDYGTTVKDVLDIVQDRTGRRGGFRRVTDGRSRDLVPGYAFIDTESYQFIEDQPPQQQQQGESIVLLLNAPYFYRILFH
jgi:hypothetical protein